MRFASDEAPYGTSMPGAGAVHHSKTGLFAAIPRKQNSATVTYRQFGLARQEGGRPISAGRGKHAWHRHCVDASGVAGGSAGLWTVGEPAAGGAQLVSKAHAARCPVH